MDKTDEILASLDRATGAEADKSGERWIDCPNCGTPAEKKHCSYGPRGWNCFICQRDGKSGSLVSLLKLLGVTRSYDTPFQRTVNRKAKPKRQEPFWWQTHAEDVLRTFTKHPQVIQKWQAYRPFTEATIRAYHLGYGVLPACSCPHNRLIYPAYNARGQIVAFRGRAVECECAKWTQSAGSSVTLWGAAAIREGCTLLVAESPVDGMYSMQEEPGLVAVASTGGAGTWRASWTAYIVSCKPRRVVTWYDNDLPGTPNEKQLPTMIAEWCAKHPNAKRHPAPNGPKVANLLRAAGLDSVLYRWPDHAPHKADLSWALMEGFV